MLDRDIIDSVAKCFEAEESTFKKEYLGKNEKGEFFYLITDGGKVKVVDALGKAVYEDNPVAADGLEKEEGEDATDEIDMKAFVKAATEKLQIGNVDQHIVDTYVAVEETPQTEEEQTIASAEPVLPTQPIPEPLQLNPISKEEGAGEVKTEETPVGEEGTEEEELTIDGEENELESGEEAEGEEGEEESETAELEKKYDVAGEDEEEEDKVDEAKVDEAKKCGFCGIANTKAIETWKNGACPDCQKGEQYKRTMATEKAKGRKVEETILDEKIDTVRKAINAIVNSDVGAVEKVPLMAKWLVTDWSNSDNFFFTDKELIEYAASIPGEDMDESKLDETRFTDFKAKLAIAATKDIAELEGALKTEEDSMGKKMLASDIQTIKRNLNQINKSTVANFSFNIRPLWKDLEDIAPRMTKLLLSVNLDKLGESLEESLEAKYIKEGSENISKGLNEIIGRLGRVINNARLDKIKPVYIMELRDLEEDLKALLPLTDELTEGSDESKKVN